MAPSTKQFSHVIFDMDGLLIDTERIYTEVMNRIAKRYNSKFTWELKVQMMGMPGIKSAQIAVNGMGLPITAEDFLVEAKQHKNELFPTCKLMPGAEKLVKHLNKHKVPIAVASGSFTSDFKTKTSRHKDFFQHFHHIVLGDDPEIKHGKPYPDVFLATASRFFDKPDPASVLVFEDAPNGVLAATRAGMGVVMVPDPNLADEHREGATLILNSLAEFKPEDFGFPAYDHNIE